MARFNQRPFLTALACVLAGALPACERKDAEIPKSSAQREQQVIPPPVQKPEYVFAEGLRDRHPEVTAFLQHFLETCLNGDYNGYRQLVSRRANPESKERFQAIYYGIRSVKVETIEPVNVPDLPPPAYRIVSEIILDPEAKVALRGRNRKIAILAFKEEGEWRIVPAPAKQQPQDAPEAANPVEPTTTAPHYPWDEEG